MRAASRAVAELRDILRAAAAKLRGLSLEGDEVEVSKCSEKMRGGGFEEQRLEEPISSILERKESWVQAVCCIRIISSEGVSGDERASLAGVSKEGFLREAIVLSLGLRDGGIVKLFGEEEKKEKCDGGDGEEGSVRVRRVDERVGKKKDEMGRVLAVGSDGETAKTNVDDGIAVFAGAEGVGEDVRRKVECLNDASSERLARDRDWVYLQASRRNVMISVGFQFRSLLQIFLFSPALFFQELKLGDGLEPIYRCRWLWSDGSGVRLGMGC
ncbi:hypothetical protein BC829DRAFT_416202 [Chytridium lagenaria]|nr:hypothetical protein BC829DRAFT_416202 [Chytridium lagenaria]